MLVTYQKIQFFFKGEIDIKIFPHKQSENGEEFASKQYVIILATSGHVPELPNLG